MPADRDHRAASEEAQHTEEVSRMFAQIARRYDILNRLNSFRRDVAWRRFTASKLRFGNTNRYLDIATGTGDLAIDVAHAHPSVRVTGLDLVEDLMDIAKYKTRIEGLDGRIDFVKGNALDLPFDDGTFDVAGIAFGIRNIKDRGHALSEMARVVVPGGQVAVLELCYHQSYIIRSLYCIYLSTVVPVVGRLVAGNMDAYSYLSRSIKNFPAPDAFEKLMAESGLKNVISYPLTLGVAHLFLGTKQ